MPAQRRRRRRGGLDSLLGIFAGRRIEEAYPYLILHARSEGCGNPDHDGVYGERHQPGLRAEVLLVT